MDHDMNLQEIRQGVKVGSYMIVKELGEGSFGKVFEGIHIQT